jgi:hypothetical protein
MKLAPTASKSAMASAAAGLGLRPRAAVGFFGQA